MKQIRIRGIGTPKNAIHRIGSSPFGLLILPLQPQSVSLKDVPVSQGSRNSES